MRRVLFVVATAVAMATPGAANALPAIAGTAFGGGLAGPILGLTHLLGLLAIGLWAGQNGGAAVWQLPAAALTAVLAAGAAAHFGVRLPYAATGLAVSLIVTGVLVAAAVRAPLVLAVLVSAVAALFHGYVQAGSWLFWAGYAAGVLLVTAAGLGLSAVLGQGVSPRLVQMCGGAVALAGLLDLVDRL